MSLPGEIQSDTLKNDLVLAVDIGGTKIALAVVTSNGQILVEKIFPTPQTGPEKGIALIIQQLEDLIRESKIEKNKLVGVGIGIPAGLETGSDLIIWAPNLSGWNQVDLRGVVEKHFGLPVSLEYDGHTAVLGEWWMGAGKNHQSVVSVVIGTGVGGGMILDGRLIRGQNRLAGTVGWFSFKQNDPGVEIEARSVGTWESLIAGVGISRRVKKLLEECSPTEKEKSNLHPNSTVKELFTLAKHGDVLALQVAKEESILIGIGLANIISMINPEIIILGGNIGTNSEFLLPQIRDTVLQYAQPISARSVEIAASKLGTQAGLFGAAYGVLMCLNNSAHI